MKTIIAAILISFTNAYATPPQTKECPSPEFHEFIHHFINNKAIQKSFTKPTITLKKIDPSTLPEPTKTTTILTHNKIKFPIIPSAHEIKKSRLFLKISSLSTTAVATISGQDSGYLINYYFEKTDCWFLGEVDDLSI